MREGTRSILEQSADLTVVGEAEDGEQVLDIVKRLQPDVAILDIRMPRLNGIEVVRRLKACCPNTKALILTAYDDDDYVLTLMEVGAAGYLLKTARASELTEAVRTVHRDEPVLHPAIWGQRGAFANQNQPMVLSDRELQILGFAAKGMRNKVIAETLDISVRTVEGHFNNILGKLGLSSRTEALVHAVSNHWITIENDDRV
jgi:DNA-binding NarL/FixJ family response regulator